MSRLKPQADVAYGLPQPLVRQNPSPIAAKRDPTAIDTGYAIGQLWVNMLTGSYFGLASVSAGAATWSTLGNVTSTYIALTSGSYATTGASAITLSAGNTFSGTGAAASIGFTFTPKGAGGLILTSGDLTVTDGEIISSTAGNGITLTSGANARIGQATLVGGTVAVANTSVTANTRVFVTRSSVGASTGLGLLEAFPTAGVGFVINSFDAALAGLVVTDVSTIDWMLVESI